MLANRVVMGIAVIGFMGFSALTFMNPERFGEGYAGFVTGVVSGVLALAKGDERGDGTP